MTKQIVKRVLWCSLSTFGAMSVAVDLYNGEFFSGSPETRFAVWIGAIWVGIIAAIGPLKDQSE